MALIQPEWLISRTKKISTEKRAELLFVFVKELVNNANPSVCGICGPA